MTVPDTQEGFADVPRETNRKLPFSEDAERAVLAAMLTDRDAVALAPTILGADDFYREAHRRLFLAMAQLQAERAPVDPITIGEQLARTGVGALPPDLLGGLYDEVPTGAHVAHHAAVVRDRSARRRLLELANALSRSAGDLAVPVDAVRDEASRHLLLAAEGEREAGFKPASSGVRKVLQRLQELEDGQLVGFQTGLPELDEKLDGGFARGDLVLVVGVPSSGKTTFMVNVLERAARAGRGSTALVSAEVKEEVVMRGVMAGHADVPLSHLRRGSLTPPEARNVVEEASRASRVPFFVDDTDTPTIEDVQLRCTLLKARHPDLVAIGIDFLQMIQRRERDRWENEELALERIAYALKNLAKRLDVVMFAAVQPNDKQVEERGDKRPTMRDLARSSGPRRACDTALLIFRPGQYSASEGNLFEVTIGKQRSGALGRAALLWDGPYLRVTSQRLRDAAAAQRRPLELEVRT